LYPLLAVGWTLNYEMAFYLVFGFALLASERYRLLCVVVGIVVLQTLLPKFGGGFTFYGEKFVYEFLFGVLIFVLHDKGWLKKINFPLAVTIFCIAIAVISTKKGLPPDGWLHTGNYLYTIGIPCAVIVAAVISQETHLPDSNLLVQMGNWSYATYLSHVIVLSAAYKATQVWQINQFVSISMACVAILAISYLSFVFVERKASLYLKKKLAAVESK
jgi:exopolysaccharide production protein ExoZ